MPWSRARGRCRVRDDFGERRNCPSRWASSPASPTAPAAAAAATTAAATVFTGLGEVDGEATAFDHRAVERLDGVLRLLVRGHLDEAEAARATRLPIGDDAGAGHGSVVGEELSEGVVGGVEGEVADVELVFGHGLFLFDLSK